MSDIVLCCTDGSDVSLKAIEAGLSLLDRSRWDVRVVCVVPDLALDPGAAGMLPTGAFSPAYSADGQDLVHAREAALDAAQERARQAAQRVDVPLDKAQALVGNPGPTLVDHARALDAALMVLGNRGLGGAVRLMLGSVSDHVLRHAPCPVLVGGEDVPAFPDGPVVICVDESERSLRAGSAVVPLLAPELPVAIATVSSSHLVRSEGTFTDMGVRMDKDEVDRLMAAAATELGHPQAELLSLTGDDAAAALVDLARSRPVRALVLGSRGHGRFVRAVLGSTAQHVVRHAPCLVCVVPLAH